MMKSFICKVCNNGTFRILFHIFHLFSISFSMLFLSFFIGRCIMVKIFPRPIIQLTDKNFVRIIDQRQNDSVFFVMFHGERCPACQSSYPGFISASKKVEGMVTFSHVDVSRSPILASRFRISSIPTFLIFHPNGVSTHRSLFRSESTFIKASTSFIPNLSTEPNISWLTDGGDSVILFSTIRRPPALWCSVSCRLASTGIRVGFTRNKSHFGAFGVTGKERIVFVKGGRTDEYTGAISYSDISSAIEQYFGSRESGSEL